MKEDSLIKETFYDWRWRLNNLYYIQDKNGHKILFRENAAQKKINNDPYPWKRILKSRQIGFTTNYLLRQFDFAIWNRNKNVFCMAHKDDSIKKLFRIVSRAYKGLEDDLKPELDRGGGSRYEFYFPEIESRISVGLESRGDTIHWLHISEAAFTDPTRIRATLEAVPKNGIITFETTPNGMGNHFYDDWVSKSRFKNYFFPWYTFEDYELESPKLKRTAEEREFVKTAKQDYGIKISNEQIAWRRAKQDDLKHLFAQEYPEDDISCFLTSGDAALNNKKVKELLDSAPECISDKDGLKIYIPPAKGRLYVCGADPAEGVGGDYSTASMFDVVTREQVATLRGQFPPAQFAEELNKFCKYYRTTGAPAPLLAVERNNHGHAVLLWLNETLLYPNLYWTKTKDKKKDKLGWLSDRVTRPLMVDALIDGIENDTIIINDADTLHECLTLVNNNGKIEAAENKHDDCFIAAAIGLQMILTNDLSIYENIGSKIRI